MHDEDAVEHVIAEMHLGEGVRVSSARLPEPLTLQYCSDVDGVRFAAVAAAIVDLAGWSLEVKDEDDRRGPTRLNAFVLETLWGEPSQLNFLGLGPETPAWVAVCDHNEWATALVSPEGERRGR